MTIRALLVDDERLARAVLRRLLEKHPDVEVVGEADSVPSAVAALVEHAPDVVFLDVQMPGGSGLQLFDHVEVRAHVVFVTAYDQYAVRAFEVNALDYLLKPVSPDRLAEALERVRGQRAAPEPKPEKGPLDPDELVCLPHRNGLRFFRLREVTHLAAADDYSEVHLADGSMVLSNITLKDWEARLPDGFLRVHRSYIANVDHVREVLRDGSSYLVRLEGQAEPVPMSRRQAAILTDRLGSRLG